MIKKILTIILTIFIETSMMQLSPEETGPLPGKPPAIAYLHLPLAKTQTYFDLKSSI